MTDIAKLYELQKLDTNLEKVRRRVYKLSKAMGESGELKAARQQVEEADAEFHRWHGIQKDAELEAEKLEARIASTEQELMSGRVRNPKELETLQASLDALKRQHAALEERGVEALLQVEVQTNAQSEAIARLAEVDADWKSGQGELAIEDTKYRRIYAHLKRQRGDLASTLDEASIDIYEKMRERKAGVAVAPIESSQCGVCHILIPTGVVSAARTRPDEVVLCPSCGRILVAT